MGCAVSDPRLAGVVLMKVYDLMMRLALYSPYAEVGVAWDGCVADIDGIVIDSKGVVIIDSPDYASLDKRLYEEPLNG